MEVNSVNVGGVQPKPNADKNSAAKLRSVVDSFIGGGVRATDEVLAQQSTASKLQVREAGLRQASNNLARVSTQAQTAGAGAEQIRGELQKLRSASGDEAKKIIGTIDRVATTTFENKLLLDGSSSGDNKISLQESLSGNRGGADDITLSLPDLSSKALVGDKPTPEKIEQAIAIVDRVVADVGAFEKSVEVIAASIDTVVANQQAAQSELQDKDLDSNALKDIRENPARAIAAQSNQLNPALVKLVN